MSPMKAARRGHSLVEELTRNGGEGMVVKPLTSSARPAGLVQPAVNAGQGILRIIYGPIYGGRNLDRLRQGPLGQRSLPCENCVRHRSLERFVRLEPLRRFMNASLACWRWKANQLIQALALQGEPSRSDGLTVAVRLQPTERGLAKRDASRQRR